MNNVSLKRQDITSTMLQVSIPYDSERHIGIDVGGTKILGVEIDSHNAIVASKQIDTTVGEQGVVRGIQSVIHGLLNQHDDLKCTREIQHVTVGIGIPGQIDVERGLVNNAVNLYINNLELGTIITKTTGFPCHVENDVNAAAVGSLHVHDSDSKRSFFNIGSDVFAFLNLGTGLAAGIIVNGKLLSGHSGVAGEIGHVPVKEFGAICECGQRGCLETIVSGKSIARLWPCEGIPIRDVFLHAEHGDSRALIVRNDFIDGIAQAVRLLVLSVDPGRIAIGGGQSRIGYPMLALLKRRLSEMAEQSVFLSSLKMFERVELVPAHTPVGALGAAIIGTENARSENSNI